MSPGAERHRVECRSRVRDVRLVEAVAAEAEDDDERDLHAGGFRRGNARVGVGGGARLLDEREQRIVAGLEAEIDATEAPRGERRVVALRCGGQPSSGR